MLPDDILRRGDGLRFYGLTPPKRGQDPDKVRAIAERQARRIAALAPDGLVLYDLQDEWGRTEAARPLPLSFRMRGRYLIALAWIACSQRQSVAMSLSGMW